LLQLRLGVKSLPPIVSKLIQIKAEGHPFFSEELAYALRDAGMIRLEDGECVLVTEEKDLALFDFPETIQGVITSRIDRLSPQQTLTLKVASVIGRVFAFKILQDVHPIPDDRSHLMEYLNNLDRLDITPLETPEPDLSYIFKHIITQEVAYNLMSFAQRRQLHQSVAQWYEKSYGKNGGQLFDIKDSRSITLKNSLNQRDSLAPYYSLLAYHWSKAQDDERAMQYFGRAGEDALRQFANQEAVDFFREALALDQKF
ncbi:MAG: hypothetical protein GWO38_01175, partial [Phycisphaerae bacterium]|nr:hypothetical protein [Phycisphaerae bacterium]NIP51402.1 hypothetical protein [Phycisphaerae bacterium]NIW48150.1 hypothetical protein [Gammaproteobacteria bacterium]NIX26258.1 hypothetical protein [Phycisphaerae bacterium]